MSNSDKNFVPAPAQFAGPLENQGWASGHAGTRRNRIKVAICLIIFLVIGMIGNLQKSEPLTAEKALAIEAAKANVPRLIPSGR